LISVALTPRISAAFAAGDQHQANSAATPNVVARRMSPSLILFILALFILDHLMTAALTTAGLTISCLENMP
jgi:hypothetical protein